MHYLVIYLFISISV